MYFNIKSHFLCYCSIRPKHNTHSLYLNIKAIPEREQDYVLLDQIYQQLLIRARQLKETLSEEYGTSLCVGNFSSEAVNNQFYLDKGFAHLNSLFTMKRDLQLPIPQLQLDKKFLCVDWAMSTFNEEQHYLNIESEIWPDTPLGHNRLTEYKQGKIEDVFVREAWRNQGFAKYLLTQALGYLKDNQLCFANLEVLTTNELALSLYTSVGFSILKEETRYSIPLD